MNSSKTLVYIGTIAGSAIGSYIPLLWGAGMFSFSSLVFGALGAIAGIIIGFRLSN